MFDSRCDCTLTIYFIFLQKRGSPYINHFLQPDTIVPNQYNPQNLNRFSYVINNPLRFADPTGHMQASDDYEDSDGKCDKKDKGCNDIKVRIELRKKIRKEIDRRFDPFVAWLPADFNYAASDYPTDDYYSELAYQASGYDLMQLASHNEDNPMTEQDWVNSGVDIDYIYSKGVRGQPPGHLFFLNYMQKDIKNPSNYEANYLNALMVTHPTQVEKAKAAYFNQLTQQYGNLQGVWDFLQMNIGVNGPD